MTATVFDPPDGRTAVADAIAAHRVERLRVGAERLQWAAHWCDLHPVDDEGEPVAGLRGMPRGKPAGADGTPLVDEFAAEELGVLLGVHPYAAQVLMADAVNLRHRHPRLWARVRAHEVVDWVAVKTARAVAAAGLDVNAARWVDAVTCGYAASLPPSRYLALVDATIIEADPAKAEARRRAFELDRFVRTGQSGEHGLKTLVARATAGEVIYLDAVVGRIAQILALQGDLDELDVRRSKALGILATPARALQLLAWAETHAVTDETDEPVDSEQPGETRNDPARNDPALNAAIAAGLAAVDPRRLLPPATLYVHLSEEALHGAAGVARLEGVGPITAGQVQSFLRHCNVTVVPVLDVAGQRPVDGYEVPARMGEAIRVLMPFESFPFATRSSRGAEHDHTLAYTPISRGGPPGQTRIDNLGPLIRRHHRLKTHAPGWRVLQPSIGVYLWRTPTGHWTRVDHHGTLPLGKHCSVMEEHLRTLLRQHQN